jgi:hypothetical protein
MAEAHAPVKHGCSRKVLLASLEDDQLVEWAAAIASILADEDAEQHCIFRNVHSHSSSRARFRVDGIVTALYFIDLLHFLAPNHLLVAGFAVFGEGRTTRGARLRRKSMSMM